MKRETPFKLAAKATLRVTERQPQQDKAMVNTYETQAKGVLDGLNGAISTSNLRGSYSGSPA